MADELAIWMPRAIDLEIIVREQVEKVNRASPEFTADEAECMITGFQDVRRKLSKWSMRSRYEAHRRLRDVSRDEELGTGTLIGALAYEMKTIIEALESHSLP